MFWGDLLHSLGASEVPLNVFVFMSKFHLLKFTLKPILSSYLCYQVTANHAFITSRKFKILLFNLLGILTGVSQEEKANVTVLQILHKFCKRCKIWKR